MVEVGIMVYIIDGGPGWSVSNISGGLGQFRGSYIRFLGV